MSAKVGVVLFILGFILGIMFALWAGGAFG